MNKKILVGIVVLIMCLGAAVYLVQPKGDTPVINKVSAFGIDALYKTAVTLQSEGDTEQSLKVFEEIVEKFPGQGKTAQAWYSLAGLYEQKQELWPKAKEAYEKIITDFPNFPEIPTAEKRLWTVNIKLLFSSFMTEKDVLYTVEPGDTLSKIAAKYNTPVELIMVSNNLKDHLIRPGERLKIAQSKCSVVVDKSQNLLTLKLDEKIFKIYPIATGKDDRTPVGQFTIVEKLKNPDWYSGANGVVPAGDSRNILGTRWLGLSTPQYGIHGGATEEDLGKQVTNGCVRMTNPDVEELYTILPRGTEVTIIN